MAYHENDPNRVDRPPLRTELVRNDPTGWIVGVVAVLAVVALIYALLPASNGPQQAPRVTEIAPRTEAPARPIPPAIPPAAPPSERPNPPTTPQ
jgi:hypothetical protein